MALWTIVHEQCVPHALAGGPPSPCLRVNFDRGDAVLKDLRGVAQVLDIPTQRVTGIEDPLLLTDEAPNYFADAWRARLEMSRLLTPPPKREWIALAINSQDERSQDQLHIHVDCLRPDVARALAEAAPSFASAWMQTSVAGRQYWALRVDSENLDGVFPFHLLAEGAMGAREQMGRWTLVAAPVRYGDALGFVLLASRSDEGGGHGEDVQDHSCAIAKAS